MRFAAGITVSGIISLILIELFKIIGPTLKSWVVGALIVAVKAALVLLVLFLAALVIGVGIFFYKRGERAGAKA